jgi:hypothetical protein
MSGVVLVLAVSLAILALLAFALSVVGFLVQTSRHRSSRVWAVAAGVSLVLLLVFGSLSNAVSRQSGLTLTGEQPSLRGYLPNRWPTWFSPMLIALEPERFGPFEQSYKVRQAGDVMIVPTPSHTPGHISVVVNTEDVTFFLAGDTSYSQSLLIERTPDGVSPRASVAIDTMDRILGLADSRPLVYLPTHDPESVDRLAEKRTLGESL